MAQAATAALTWLRVRCSAVATLATTALRLVNMRLLTQLLHMMSVLHLAALAEAIVGVGDTANFGIDPIPSKYRASIADTDTDTFNLKIPDQIMILYFCL